MRAKKPMVSTSFVENHRLLLFFSKSGSDFAFSLLLCFQGRKDEDKLWAAT